jgi:spore coat protein X
MASSSRDKHSSSSSRSSSEHKEKREYEKKEYKSSSKHDDHEKKNREAEVMQDADQFVSTEQESDELIFIKDSCNIKVQTTDTQAAVSLQVGLQLAIAIVVRITLFDSPKGESILQDLMQHFDSVQTNKQKVIIKNSKDVCITTTDTDLSVNIQALLQVLVSLVVKLDVA